MECDYCKDVIVDDCHVKLAKCEHHFCFPCFEMDDYSYCPICDTIIEIQDVEIVSEDGNNNSI